MKMYENSTDAEFDYKRYNLLVASVWQEATDDSYCILTNLCDQ